MSEEEKEAIETTKILIEFSGDNYIPKQNREKLQILLNLIEKQQKEIEEKTTILFAGAEKVKQLEKEIEQLRNKLEFDYVKAHYIDKDKIREVIKKYYDDYEEQKRYRYTLDVEDEQNVLKDIEKELLEE